MRSVSALVLVLAAPVASAQVVAHPNQVTGTFTLTNTNPAIVELLQTRGLGDLNVSATSVGSPWLYATARGVRVDALHATYEITVEAGTPGIAYNVGAEPSYLGATPRNRSGTSVPVEPEPAPDVTVDFADCMGVITVHLVDPVGDPVIGSTATVNGRRPPPGSNELQWLVPDGVTVSFRVVVETGTDPLHDTVLLEYTAGSATAHCDEFTAFDCIIDPTPCDDGEGIAFGSIIGNVDVVGAPVVVIGTPNTTSSRTSMVAELGPFDNRRWDVLNTATRARGAFELENLVASDTSPTPRNYLVSGLMALDVDGVTELLDLATIAVNVPGDTVVDLGDTFVIDPSDVRCSVLLAGPPSSPARGRPMLADTEATASGRGTSTRPAGASRASEGMDGSIASIDELYDDASASMAATWRLLTGGLNKEPSVQDFLTTFRFEHRGDPAVPTDWYRGTFSFAAPESQELELQPGDRHDLAARACVGQVLIGIRSTGAPFYRPRISAWGTLDGIDFEGNRVQRWASGSSSGLPDALADAAVAGTVKLCLPEGDYTLSTTATFVNPSGGTSSTTLRPIELHVGCRQVITGTPEIVERMTRAPSCAGTLPVTVAGSVSADEEISSITWSVDGGAATDACRPCGINPDYEILVPGTGSLQMEIFVKATDTLGREATVTHFARFADEPSATDLDPSAIPLMATRSPEGMRLTWGTAAGVSYSLYRGSIATIHAGRYDHAAFGACGLASPEWSGALPAGDSYFLATSACGFGDAPLGRDSFGRERPGAGPRCP